MKTVICRSEHETFLLGIKLAEKARPGEVFSLSGELGTGKTIIAKGIAQSLGINPDEVTSPTFNLFEAYEGNLPLYHFDLYRIEHKEELDNLFFEDYWEGAGISVIEWAERAGNRLPESAIKINIEYLDEQSRRITIEHPGN